MAKVSLIQIFNLYTNCVDAPGNDGAWGLVLNIYIFGVVSLSEFENRVSDAVITWRLGISLPNFRSPMEIPNRHGDGRHRRRF